MNICLHFCYLLGVELLAKVCICSVSIVPAKEFSNTIHFSFLGKFHLLHTFTKTWYVQSFYPSWAKVECVCVCVCVGVCVHVCICVYVHAHMCMCMCLLQFSSATQACATFCDPRDCSMPGFPVHHQLPELAQTHVRIFLFQNQFHCDLIYI